MYINLFFIINDLHLLYGYNILKILIYETWMFAVKNVSAQKWQLKPNGKSPAFRIFSFNNKRSINILWKQIDCILAVVRIVYQYAYMITVTFNTIIKHLHVKRGDVK
jgi:hypothetical protein